MSTIHHAPYVTLEPLFDELVGQRIVVRSYRETDAQALMEAVSESREHVRPWLPFADAHQTVEESRNWIIQEQAHILLRENMNFCLIEKASGRFLGGIGMNPHDWVARAFEIGYWLRVSATDHGYMTEAAKLLTDYLLDKLHANRVEIRCDARNKQSAAVAQRLNFVLEGRLRNQYITTSGALRDTLVFSLVPGDRR